MDGLLDQAVAAQPDEIIPVAHLPLDVGHAGRALAGGGHRLDGQGVVGPVDRANLPDVALVNAFEDFAAWQLSRELEETKDHIEAAFERGYISEQERNELITLGNRALGASTRLAQYLDEAAKTWASKRGHFRRRRKNPEPEEPEPEP